jgi:hypothetical protein
MHPQSLFPFNIRHFKSPLKKIPALSLRFNGGRGGKGMGTGTSLFAFATIGLILCTFLSAEIWKKLDFDPAKNLTLQLSFD